MIVDQEFSPRRVLARTGLSVSPLCGSGILAKGPDAYARYEYRESPKEMVERARATQATCGEFGVPLTAPALQFSLRDER